MANFIPIAGSPDAAGGHLIQPEYAQPLVDAIARESVVDRFVSWDRVSTRKRKYPRMVGRPTASFVDEAGDIQATGAEFASLEINVKKIGTTLLYTEEELEDAYADPESLVGPEVEKAFADLIDAHVLGMAGGAAIATSFDADIHSQTPAGGQIELGVGQDALAVAVSAGMGFVEGNGGIPNGIALALDLRQHIRDARDGNGRPLYSDNASSPGSVTGAPAMFSTMPAGTTTNLDALPAGAGKVAAIGGDWTYAKGIIRRDITVRVADQATINVAGTDHRTFQQEKIAVKYTGRFGFNVHQGNKHFFEVRNAA